MTEIIIIAVLFVFIVALFIASFIVLNKYKKRLIAAKLLATTIAFDILRGIQEDIDRFNEEYDVQLSIGMSEEKEKRRVCLKFTDPKDENTNENPQPEQPTEK